MTKNEKMTEKTKMSLTSTLSAENTTAFILPDAYALNAGSLRLQVLLIRAQKMQIP